MFLSIIKYDNWKIRGFTRKRIGDSGTRRRKRGGGGSGKFKINYKECGQRGERTEELTRHVIARRAYYYIGFKRL